MNDEKAREFFSAYFDGSLSGPLKTTFSRRLQESPSLQAEYAAFEQLMKRLEPLGAEPVEVPNDLHEMIAARLDRHRFEQKKKATPPFILWWRSLAGGTLALSAILFAVLSYNNNSSTHTAGLGPNVSVDRLDVATGKSLNSVVLKYSSSSPDKIVVIRKGLDGEVIRRHELHGMPLSSEIGNKDSRAVIISVQVMGEAQPTLIALPGTDRENDPKGKGTITDMARAMAGYYRVPVEVTTSNPNQAMNWNFSGKLPLDSVSNELKTLGFSAEEKSTGAIHIAPL